MAHSELGTRKTVFVLVIVVGCFAILWPKIFYPMLVGHVHQHIKPIKNEDCCDFIWENDVDAIKVMLKLCEDILSEQKQTDPRVRLAFENKKLTKNIINNCREKVQTTCNIDISTFLNENIRLGKNYIQILDELRSTNSSLCLKYNFGISPVDLGVPHRIGVNSFLGEDLRQERPPHLKTEMLHPALRERGKAIPSLPSHVLNKLPSGRPAPKIVPGSPGPIPGMRPTLGGAGHVVPPSKTSSYNSMGLIMPIYTIGIIVFFLYTLMKVILKIGVFVFFTSFPVTKVLCKLAMGLYFIYTFIKIMFKKPNDSLHGEESEEYYQNHFGSYHYQQQPNNHQETAFNHKAIKENGNSKKLGDIEIDQLRRRLKETEDAMARVIAQMSSVPQKKIKIRAQITPNCCSLVREPEEFNQAKIKDAISIKHELCERLEQLNDEVVQTKAINETPIVQPNTANNEKAIVLVDKVDEKVEKIKENIEERNCIKEKFADIINEINDVINFSEKQINERREILLEKKLSADEDKHDRNEETTTIKILGMEISESCQGGQKWSRPTTPLPPPPVRLSPPKTPEPPPVIYLDGKLPPKSELVVSNTAEIKELMDEEENSNIDDDEPAIMLSGKMTLSVIPSDKARSVDDENATEADVDDIEDSKYVTVSGATEELPIPSLKKDTLDESDQEEELEYEEEVDVEMDELKEENLGVRRRNLNKSQ